MVELRVVNKGRQPLPAYATKQSAGLDLRADIDEDVILQPLQRQLIPTGLHIALPEGYEAQVRPRSGLALKQDPFTVHPGERVAQLVVARYEQADLVSVDVLDETERGEGGYGHTGVK